MTPGQLGPINLQFLFFMYVKTFDISLIGIPSVIATITLIPASHASMIASAANPAGTKMIEVSASV